MDHRRQLQEAFNQCFPTPESRNTFPLGKIRVKVHFSCHLLQPSLETLDILSKNLDNDNNVRYQDSSTRSFIQGLVSKVNCQLESLKQTLEPCEATWNTTVANILNKVPVLSLLMTNLTQSQNYLNGGTLYERGIYSRDIFLRENPVATMKAHYVPAILPPIYETAHSKTIVTQLPQQREKKKKKKRMDDKIFELTLKTIDSKYTMPNEEVLCRYKFQCFEGEGSCIPEMYMETRFVAIRVPNLDGRLSSRVLRSLVNRLSGEETFESPYHHHPCDLDPQERASLLHLIEYFGLNYENMKRPDLLNVKGEEESQLGVTISFPDLSDLDDVELV